ncbi:MAG: 30S ribosomal protein S7 [Clostridia bacterium]|nr:MAG: 30S ribosomal protein S7 [Clostridia bacterium]
MPRRGRIPRRDVALDPLYNSKVVTKLINQIMWDGKKSTAQKVFYQALDLIRQRSGRDPQEVLEQAMKNVMPMLEVKARRVGGANYQVPIEVRPERRQTLAVRWITNYARARTGRNMEEKLAAELLDAANNTGGAVKKKEDTHRMAEANRAFAHYRW